MPLLRYPLDRLLRRQKRIDKYGPIIVAIFAEVQLPANWALAFAQVESNFKPWADNLVDPGDVRRGGSYGMFMMSLKTAREDCGYTADIAGLYDLAVNANLASRFIRGLAEKSGMDLSMVGARYNSGRAIDKLPSWHRTRTVYVPDLLHYANGEFKDGIPPAATA